MSSMSIKPDDARDVREVAVLPDWCNVYSGLSDEEIERLDAATKQRLDLSRGSGEQNLAHGVSRG